MLYYGLGRSLADVPATKAGGGAAVSRSELTPSEYVDPRAPYGYTSFGISTLWNNYLLKLGTRVAATIASIQQTGQITTPYPAQSMVGCQYQRNRAYTDLLDSPGVIDQFGVKFSVDELKAGKLERTFVPNAEQRFLIDYAIYARSQAQVAGAILGRGCGGEISMPIGAAAVIERRPSEYVLAAFQQRDNNASVETMMKNLCSNQDDALTTWIDGFSMNPIQPTEDELKNAGGLKRYYERGGFLISRCLARGACRVDETGQLGLHWGVGYYLCPNPQFWASGRADRVGGGNRGATPDDYAGGVPTPALFYHTAEGEGWDVYVTVGEPEYKMLITPHDPGVGQKILQGIAAIMQKLREALCAIVPLTQPIMQQQLLAELCVDANGKSCTKGTPGCKCTQPTTGQKDAVAATSALVSGICAMGHDTPQELPPPQQISPPSSGPVEKKIPWWGIVLGGISIGAAIAFTPRR